MSEPAQKCENNAIFKHNSTLLLFIHLELTNLFLLFQLRRKIIILKIFSKKFYKIESRWNFNGITKMKSIQNLFQIQKTVSKIVWKILLNSNGLKEGYLLPTYFREHRNPQQGGGFTLLRV